MNILSYQIVNAKTPDQLQEKVAALLPALQPVGAVIADQNNRMFLQAMAGYGGAVVTDGMELTAVEPTGSYTDTVTFTVADGEITAIVLS